MKSENLAYKIVNRYIGVSGGYLGLPIENRFTYRTHQEFYPEYCDLNKDTYASKGTTREVFIHIFTTSSPQEQAKIIRGVIERFPVEEGPTTRTEALKAQLLSEAQRLETASYVGEPTLEIDSEAVFGALDDARSLIQNRKAVSAVDRVHTAFQGYLRTVCRKENISFDTKDDLVSLIKKLFAAHPKLTISHKADEIKNIVRNLVSISDSLNPIRNQGSRAHPNERLLDEPEAVLVINSVRTVMTYLESKLQ
jgi:hypothetical protein